MGYTVIYYRFEDGKPCVAGRFETAEEKDKFLEEINAPDSGWLYEELMSISVVPNYNYMLEG